MFRCITRLKGLIVDADSFEIDDQLQKWKEFKDSYQLVFLTSNETSKVDLSAVYGEERVLFIEPFRKLFAPSIISHEQVLRMLGLVSTEVAYVSQDADFLVNAMGFLGGTIWITNSVSYENASNVADLVCKDLTILKMALDKEVKGFLGEAALFPNEESRGMIVPVTFMVDGQPYSLYMLGRYFGYSHYMNQLHPYSSAIYLNKRKNKKYTGIFNSYFAKLYAFAVRRIIKNESVDGICSIPVRPGEINRFAPLIHELTNQTGITDFQSHLQCVKDYPTQKGLSEREREENIQGAFGAHDVAGKNMILIDDVASTGSTLREAIRTLKNAGANKIFIIALAINQVRETYWSSNVAQVRCPKCGNRMHLLINSHSRELFYSCYDCSATLDFIQGRNQIINWVNQENHLE